MAGGLLHAAIPAAATIALRRVHSPPGVPVRKRFMNIILV